MHIKFTNHGCGNAKKAADYLTQKLDSKGVERTEVKVLRGDPYQVAMVSDSLSFKHKYTSGVISFSPEEKPTDKELKEILNRFEEVAFAGLEPHRYAFSAIKHGEKSGGCHIHVFVARCELETGKSLNIAQPGHIKLFDLVRDEFNYSKGLARPDDPLRKRILQHSFNKHKNTLSEKQAITDFLMANITEGFIDNRQDIINSLQEVGMIITRQGDNYISLKTDITKKAIRLKGAIYDRDFERSKLERTPPKEIGKGYGRGGTIEEGMAQEIRERISKRIKRRSDYNRQRYSIPDKQRPQEIYTKELERTSKRDKNLRLTNDKIMEEDFYCGPSGLSRFIHRQLGADYISIEQNKRSIDQNRRQQKKVEKTRRNGNGDSQRQQGESLSNYTETPQVKGIERLRRQKDIYNRTGVNNENVQIERIRGIIRRRSFSDIFVLKSVCDGLKKTRRRLEHSARRIRTRARKFENVQYTGYCTKRKTYKANLRKSEIENKFDTGNSLGCEKVGTSGRGQKKSNSNSRRARNRQAMQTM
jgi:hypothetical protein